MEFLLEATEALEVVELLAVAKRERAESIPERRRGARLEARERRHADVQPRVALLLRPESDAEEKVLHHARRRPAAVAHQVRRELLVVGAAPEVREGDHLASGARDREGELGQVRRI